MRIGTFGEQDNGTFSGEIVTLGINQSVGIVPVSRKTNSRSPDYVVTNDDDIDFGVAWKRTSKAGKAYLSVRLDSPLFPQPVDCALIATGVSHQLWWNREAPGDKSEAAAAQMIEQ